jgi:hypothetical protein
MLELFPIEGYKKIFSPSTVPKTSFISQISFNPKFFKIWDLLSQKQNVLISHPKNSVFWMKG